MTGSLSLSIVVPVYNEAGGVGRFAAAVAGALADIEYEIIFALDPCEHDCEDRTRAAICELMSSDKRVRMLVMSRRFGQAACTLAGLVYAKGDACVVMDSDLQDPPALIPEMIRKWREGNDVVYARRRSKKGENPVRSFVAHAGYRVISLLARVPIPRDTGDFRLMSSRVVKHVVRLGDSDFFLRGLTGLVGFKHAAVEYDRVTRACGTTKYNRWTGSIKVGLDGIFGFSMLPLHLILAAGAVMMAAGFFMGFAWMAVKISGRPGIPGVTAFSTVFVVFGGIQLLALGIVGQYLARIFNEVKRRPAFIVAEEHGFEQKAAAQVRLLR